MILSERYFNIRLTVRTLHPATTNCTNSAMKTWRMTQHFDDNMELWEGVTNWLISAKFYISGISKLVQRYDKCLNLYGDFVKKIILVSLSNVYNTTFFLNFVLKRHYNIKNLVL
ncbi:hypothetical protein J6590_077750 [Homalodisca vitripennis]|nr:hypothetical protein J6590_077750 [Homalodisca vitripennis]